MEPIHLTSIVSQFLPIELQDLAQHSTPIVNHGSSPVVCDSVESAETSVLSSKPLLFEVNFLLII